MSPLLNRRSFVKAASGAAAAAAVLPLFHASADGAEGGARRSLRKGIMYGTIGIQGSVMEKLRAVKEAGFEGVEPNSHMNQEEVLEARDTNGLQTPSVCCSTHWDKPITDPNSAVRQKGLEGLEQALRDAHRYGASSVLFVPGVVNKHVSYDEAFKRAHEGIRQAVSLAQELKVRIALENVWNHFLLSPLEAAAFVDAFDSPWVGWHFDVGNVITYGWPEQWIRILNKRIAKLHIKEFSRDKANKQGLWKGFDVEFLKGDNDWPTVMKALDEIGYDGWGIAEQPGGNSPEGLRKLVDGMNRIFAS